MRIIRELPPLRGTLVQHVRRMVFEAEIRELANVPEHLLNVMSHLHSAPEMLAPTMRSIHFQRSPE